MNASKIPALLIAFRAIAGPILIFIALIYGKSASIVCAFILALGVLSDIFDGVIARRLKIVTDNLRIWDSRVDVIFWVCTAIALHIIYPKLWNTTQIMVLTLLFLEVSARLISHLRFKKEASTHHLLSKIFTLSLWALISQLFLTGEIGWLFWFTLILGIISQIESIAILLIIPHYKTDIKGISDALKLRKLGNQ